MRKLQQIGVKGVAAVGTVVATSFAMVAITASAASAARVGLAKPAADTTTTTCALGNGVQHVIEITFDNVHFFRDNPNIPSDLQLMPNLLQFIENNGTMLSNNHTPLIAHTADDILTTFTGLYGDRQGMPGNNSYLAYNADGTTDLAGSFAYWTDPVFDEASTPNPGHDTNPSMVYATAPPATARPLQQPNTVTPAPWVPYTRAGCDVGEVGTANQELENTGVDFPKVFGPNSPEVQQLTQDPDSFKDPETSDYVGIGVHCAQADSFCSSAQAVKFGQTSPSPTAVADLLPDEPGGYGGYQALFGHRYVAPQLGAGTPNLMSGSGYQVTNAAGNLVDLNGHQINGAFVGNSPGFPGFSHINASQTLAYMADMLESHVRVVNGYISDIHGSESINDPAVQAACAHAPSALPPGTACYIAQAQYYNQAFATFFQRLAADGITPQNSLFVFSSDEGDHVAGANVGRAVQPTPAGCDGATVSGTTVTPDVLCTYPKGSFGELSGDMTGMLATQANDTTPLSIEADTAPQLFVTGNPDATSPNIRTLERDVAGLTAFNPYTNTTQPVTNYMADPTEMAILHMVTADPARTPTFAMFAKPDYFFSSGPATCGPCVSQTTSFAYDHGDYAAEIDTNWLGIAGPGVQNLGLDGSAADAGPSSAGADSGQVTVPGSGTTGTWADESDIRPTIMYLAGLRDDYEHDGRVITPILTNPNDALSAPAVEQLGACYKQLNSSVGEFGTDTLIAATAAIESDSPGDSAYLATDDALHGLDVARDRIAGIIKRELSAAAFDNARIKNVVGMTAACGSLIDSAHQLAVAAQG